MDSNVKLYLKPRPVHSKLGDRLWMLIRPDFMYGPFFPAWQPVPSDATEVHTVYSPALATALTKLYVEVLPKVRKCESDIPRIRTAMSANPFSAFNWEGFIIMAQCDDLLTDCWYQPVKLVFGDKAPPLPPRRRRSPKHAPKYWKLVEDAVFPIGRGRELVDVDTDLQRIVWTTIYMVLMGYR
ncbi:uncharacterized protein EV420DRAFT_1642209 [Desarmillaria tabescens]|uniref:Uncharacterized protein n=1 Tax=Armillaria tabescens TaxID=1929756 RepID=A0AA39N6H8_ARMTA|nr:uncharacterized protein EV420DRAFT_1642209 [Desarmillaria tabescens]KAK0459229.1 hypothetical protein EV420DRAFT_1642209 [Desarmillaria tabescens]